MRGDGGLRRAAQVAGIVACGCGPSAGMSADDAAIDTTGVAASEDGGPGASDDTAGPGSPGPSSSSGPPPPDPTPGTTDDGADESGSTGGPEPESGPSHLLLFRTPHGVYADDVWAGQGEDYELGPVLQPLAPFADALLMIDGIDNVVLLPDGGSIDNIYGVTSAALLTGGRFGSVLGDPGFTFWFGGGPSVDVLLGEALSASSPHGHVHLGVAATGLAGLPMGVSYFDADMPVPPLDDPHLAFDLLFGAAPPDPLLDELQAALAEPIAGPERVLELQLAIAHAAIALDVAAVQLVSVDRGLPAIHWAGLGVDDDYHALVAFEQAEQVATVQTFWAEQLAAVLARLQATPTETGTLLEETLVVWIAPEGSPPNAYSMNDIFVVVVDAGGSLSTGRVAEVEADQADFAVTIAEVMGVPLPGFGHPDLDATVIDELLTR